MPIPRRRPIPSCRCIKTLRPQVESQNLTEVYETIDLPLVRVLARMEEIGIRVDPVQLRHMSGRMEEEIARLSGEICAIAGKTFNISSPQQLGKVLFEDMNLPAPTKMGKGKVISTAAGRAGGSGGGARDRPQGSGASPALETQRNLLRRASAC